MILRMLPEAALMGTAILRVQHTGDFTGKNAGNIIRIYDRLSHLEGGLIPPVVGFIFDRENRSKTKREDLQRPAPERIHFIGKRLFENYLLNPAAITAVLQTLAPQITEQQVREWLEQNKTQPKYYDRHSELPRSELWTDNVNGALLLEDLFSHLTDHHGFFDKTKHSPMLTKWLLENCPEELEALSKLLTSVVTGTASTN
jgi:hypothetical protein